MLLLLFKGLGAQVGRFSGSRNLTLARRSSCRFARQYAGTCGSLLPALIHEYPRSRHDPGSAFSVVKTARYGNGPPRGTVLPSVHSNLTITGYISGFRSDPGTPGHPFRPTPDIRPRVASPWASGGVEWPRIPPPKTPAHGPHTTSKPGVKMGGFRGRNL